MIKVFPRSIYFLSSNPKTMQTIKILKELGSGGNGTAYLANVDDKLLVYKIEKHDVHDKKKPLTSEYLRQVKFDLDIAQHHPEHFMILKGHGIIKNPTYVHPKTEFFASIENEDRKRRFLRKNTQDECFYLIYSPVLEGTFNDVEEEILSNKDLFLDFLHQIITSINIMHKNGYSQNDFNGSNIMFKKIKDKYQWYLIDYGQIWHESFPVSQLDQDLVKRGGKTRNHDLFKFLTGYLRLNLTRFRKKYDITFIPVEEFDEKMKLLPEFQEITSFKLPLQSKEKQPFGMVKPFQALYPDVFLKTAGVSDELVKTYVKEYYDLPKALKHYIFTHIYDKDYDEILKSIKMITYI